MDSFKTDRAVYTPTDFVVWEEQQMLILTPKFQRRSVWRVPARSFFMDTLLRGMTVPPIYLRMTQSKSAKKVVREVVDGQQRVRSVLDFMRGEFRLSKTLNGSWAGKKFDQLSEDEQHRIRSFGFSAEIFQGISDEDILNVFCRLNMNGVPLNRQELRNGKFFGSFKDTAFSLSVSHLEFWRHQKIFSEQSIARMLEVELTSELLIAGVDGMQDKKNNIDTYYEKWEKEYPTREKDERRFKETISTIADAFNGDLADSEFHRPPLFFTLYCVVYHYLYGLPGIKRQSPKKRMGEFEREGLKEAVLRLSEKIIQSKEPDSELLPKHAAFVAACQRQTDNIAPRTTRFNTLYEESF